MSRTNGAGPRTDWLPEESLRSALPSAAESTQLLTAEDLAARWQVPTSHIYRLARDGKLPVVRLGRYRRFTLTAIVEFEANGGTGEGGGE